SNPKKTRCLP
ncbi:unnamed protein product, partial [Allacma fusca]